MNVAAVMGELAPWEWRRAAIVHGGRHRRPATPFARRFGWGITIIETGLAADLYGPYADGSTPRPDFSVPTDI